MSDNFITQKVGPLPLVVWVAGGAGVIGLFILMTHKGNNTAQGNQTNSVQALAPTEAEAFGTIEQQQQDVTNALTTLGQNQSALGGSMSSLTGIVTQQGLYNSAQFQNLANGQQQIEQGLTSGFNAQSAQSTAYYNGILQNMLNYYNSLGSQLNGINGNIVNMSQGLSTKMDADVARQFADFTYLEAGPSDPRIGQWIALSQNAGNQAAAQLAKVQ